MEFSKIILVHEREPDYQEPQEDRVALQELLRSFTMQQKSKMQKKISSPWIRGSRSLLSTQAHRSWLHQPREGISNHYHCQRHQNRPQHLNQQSLLTIPPPRISNASRTSSSLSSPRSATRVNSASAATPAIRSATSSDQKKNH